MHKILYLLLFPALVYGQTAQETVERKLKFANEQFQTSDKSNFIVATPYIKNYAGIAGSQFWNTEVWCSAEVLYKGNVYPVPELKYDCTNDLMVIPRYSEQGLQLLNLIPSCYPEVFINIKYTGNLHGKVVSEIPFKREHFIFYPSSKDEKSDGIPSGYYHYLIEKQVSLLCKYSSIIMEINGQKAFQEEKKFFLQKDGKLLRIRRVGNFIEAFPPLKDKINAYVDENKINTLLSLDSGEIEKLIEFINTLSTK